MIAITTNNSIRENSYTLFSCFSSFDCNSFFSIEIFILFFNLTFLHIIVYFIGKNKGEFFQKRGTFSQNA